MAATQQAPRRINDASKSRPDWVRAVCARWALESETPQTAWIVKHALRTLRKQGDAARTEGAR